MCFMRRMYICWCLCGIVYRHLLDLFAIRCHLSLGFLYFPIFWRNWNVESICYYCVLFTSVFNSISMCFMKLSTINFGAHLFSIVIFFLIN